MPKEGLFTEADKVSCISVIEQVTVVTTGQVGRATQMILLDPGAWIGAIHRCV